MSVPRRVRRRGMALLALGLLLPAFSAAAGQPRSTAAQAPSHCAFFPFLVQREPGRGPAPAVEGALRPAQSVAVDRCRADARPRPVRRRRRWGRR